MPPPHERPEDTLLRHFDARLAACGDTADAAASPNEADRQSRFDALLDIIEPESARPAVLCDLGCGAGELLAHIRDRGISGIEYLGADRSRAALAQARAKFPDARFVEIDVTAPDADLAAIACDYLVANGAEMRAVLPAAVERLWPHVRRGVAFGVEADGGLSQLPMDGAAALLHRLAGRRVRLRADYGLDEYTAYATRPPLPQPDEAPPHVVPVLRPRLAGADRLLPYLRRIDAARVYSNHGPLTTALERRLAALLALPVGGVASGGSGTAALAGAILATAGRAAAARPLALLPAFTFVATAIAAEQCGYRPYLLDVDPETWMLDPARLLGHEALARAGVVLPVAPFGRPVPQAGWAAFTARTGVPVVIDGAASFDRIADAPGDFLGPIPVAFSFHATKAFATGEGGGVAVADAALLPRVVQALNFGFRRARDAEIAGLNGKMSEYHAAVGLAELDAWPEKRLALRAVAARYRAALAAGGLAARLVAAPSIGLSYALFRAADAAEAARVAAALRQGGVDTRLWYSEGVQRQTHYRTAAREALVVTEALAPCLLALPWAADLGAAEMARVVAALTQGIGAGAQRGAAAAGGAG